MSTPTTQQLLEEYTGKAVPYSFNGGFVCLSYAISLVGSGTTLELIRRRTSHRGRLNLLLLVGAAISMGGIAIWSMHFIGNRAIYILHGEEVFQIAYSTTQTVMSLLVPIFVLVLAFLGVSGNGRIRWWRIGIAGILSGASICGMHYLADSSISNYSSSYRLSYLIGSVVIAVLASTSALALFFVFENTWNNAWWKRLGCAMVLSGAVSGMHWCAAIGTSYTLKHETGKVVSRRDAMIVVICLAMAAGIVLIGLAVYASWVRREYAGKAQQVVLAAGVFDEKGRIMVGQDGYLPSEVVTDTYLPKSNGDIFNNNHVLFHWMFRASHKWDAITKVIDKMATHISLLAQERSTSRAGVRLIGDDGVLVDDYDTILRELFCLSANTLAAKTRESLDRVGTLWDEIFVTGELTRNAAPSHKVAKDANFSLQSLTEKGSQQHGQGYGRGCLMFLVRRVNSKREIDRLEAFGYRFAEIHQVVNSIRSSMQIKTPELEARLRSMSNQRDEPSMLSPGVHVGLFAVRARLDRSGFDVLAQKTAKNLLPSVSLAMDRLEPGHTGFLNCLRGMTLGTTLLKLGKHQHISPQEKSIVIALRDAISSLRGFIDDETFDEATLLPREVQLPCSADLDNKGLSECTLIAFQLIIPIHASVLSAQCELVPLSFFKARQLTYKGSSHEVEFAHMVHRDMSFTIHDASARRYSAGQANTKYLSRAVGKVRDTLPDYRQRVNASSLPPTKSQEELSKEASHPSSLFNGDDESFDDVRKLSSASHLSTTKKSYNASYKEHSQGKQLHMLGSIMVSQEVSISVQQTQTGEDDPNFPELNGPGSETLHSRADTQENIGNYYTVTATVENTSAGQGKHEEATFVDELFSLGMQASKQATV